MGQNEFCQTVTNTGKKEKEENLRTLSFDRDHSHYAFPVIALLRIARVECAVAELHSALVET